MSNANEEKLIEACIFMALDDRDGPEQHFLDVEAAISSMRGASRKKAISRAREVIRRLQYWHTPFLEYGNKMLVKLGAKPVRQETETIISSPRRLAGHLRALAGDPSRFSHKDLFDRIGDEMRRIVAAECGDEAE